MSVSYTHLDVYKRQDLDEVWFMVTPHNPLKEENELMDDKLSLKLVQLATEGYPKFRTSDFEFHLHRPSYNCLLYTSRCV